MEVILFDKKQSIDEIVKELKGLSDEDEVTQEKE